MDCHTSCVRLQVKTRRLLLGRRSCSACSLELGSVDLPHAAQAIQGGAAQEARRGRQVHAPNRAAPGSPRLAGQGPGAQL